MEAEEATAVLLSWYDSTCNNFSITFWHSISFVSHSKRDAKKMRRRTPSHRNEWVFCLYWWRNAQAIAMFAIHATGCWLWLKIYIPVHTNSWTYTHWCKVTLKRNMKFADIFTRADNNRQNNNCWQAQYDLLVTAHLQLVLNKSMQHLTSQSISFISLHNRFIRLSLVMVFFNSAKKCM